MLRVQGGTWCQPDAYLLKQFHCKRGEDDLELTMVVQNNVGDTLIESHPRSIVGEKSAPAIVHDPEEQRSRFLASRLSSESA